MEDSDSLMNGIANNAQVSNNLSARWQQLQLKSCTRLSTHQQADTLRSILVQTCYAKHINRYSLMVFIQFLYNFVKWCDSCK